MRLPAGDHCVCVVVNDEYPVGSTYAGQPIQCQTRASDGQPGAAFELWTPAGPGLFDVLAFGGACAALSDTILAADDASDAAGLSVGGPTARRVPGPGVFLAALCLLLAMPLARRAGRVRRSGRS
jgi:hypothetical protein